jgi:hypothetical protein
MKTEKKLNKELSIIYELKLCSGKYDIYVTEHKNKVVEDYNELIGVSNSFKISKIIFDKLVKFKVSPCTLMEIIEEIM